jgi:hypothetical protein
MIQARKREAWCNEGARCKGDKGRRAQGFEHVQAGGEWRREQGSETEEGVQEGSNGRHGEPGEPWAGKVIKGGERGGKGCAGEPCGDLGRATGARWCGTGKVKKPKIEN